MGYDIHITRKEHWSDEDVSLDISLSEWNLIVSNDLELEIDDSAKIFTSDGERNLCKWKKKINEKDIAWFDLYDGNISAKNPNDDTISKMCAIALLLKAKVQGDDSEIY